MFGKYFASTFTGSMAGAGLGIFAVWGYVIANAVNSQVELNPKVMAALLGTAESIVAESINYLCQPDTSSRSPLEDGRRLIKEGAFAYRVVNHSAYRSIRDEQDRREYNRNKKREGRANGVNAHVNQSIRESKMSAQAEAEAEAEAEAVSTISATPTVLELQSPSEYDLERKKEKEVIEAAFEHYCISTEKNRLIYRLTPARSKIATVRLKECLKLTAGDYQKATDLLKDAIDNLAASNFHMGRDPKTNGKKYCDWIKNLFKSYEQMEAWWQ